MPIDEMIIASINCLDEIEEHFKTQMIAWVRSAADFSEINDKLVKENEQLKNELQDYQFNYDNIKELSKENKKLKEKLNAWERGNPIGELETEISELKKDKERLDNTNNEQTAVILELQAQIEKMCCKNIYPVSDKNSNAVPCYTIYN